MAELISIVEAAKRGICRLREPQWANARDYLKIDIIDGVPGPWAHLYSPANEIVGNKNPHSFVWALFPNSDVASFYPYEGERDPADTKEIIVNRKG